MEKHQLKKVEKFFHPSGVWERFGLLFYNILGMVWKWHLVKWGRRGEARSSEIDPLSTLLDPKFDGSILCSWERESSGSSGNCHPGAIISDHPWSTTLGHLSRKYLWHLRGNYDDFVKCAFHGKIYQKCFCGLGSTSKWNQSKVQSSHVSRKKENNRWSRCDKWEVKWNLGNESFHRKLETSPGKNR